MNQDADIRRDALAQLKKAQHIIEEGRKELAAAHEKISAAQKLIDESAETLRDTPTEPPHAAGPR